MWYRLAFQSGSQQAAAPDWNASVDQQDHLGGDLAEGDDGTELVLKGQGVEAEEKRRQSPVHSNPEFTVMEEKLEAVRHQNNNHPLSNTTLSALEGGRGEMNLRSNPFGYQSGKGSIGPDPNSPSHVTRI